MKILEPMPNYRTPLDAATALLFDVVARRRGASEFIRYA
jgi:hypothetical protein